MCAGSWGLIKTWCQKLTSHSCRKVPALTWFSYIAVFKDQPQGETSVESPAGNRIKSWRKGPHHTTVAVSWGRDTKLFLTGLSVMVSPASPVHMQFTPFRTQHLTRRLFPPHQCAAKPEGSGMSAPTRVEQPQERHNVVSSVKEGGSPTRWYSTDRL